MIELMSVFSDPGSFQFEKRGHLVKESCGEAVLSVIRFQTLPRIMNLPLSSSALSLNECLDNL